MNSFTAVKILALCLALAYGAPPAQNGQRRRPPPPGQNRPPAQLGQGQQPGPSGGPPPQGQNGQRRPPPPPQGSNDQSARRHRGRRPRGPPRGGRGHGRPGSNSTSGNPGNDTLVPIFPVTPGNDTLVPVFPENPSILPVPGPNDTSVLPPLGGAVPVTSSPGLAQQDQSETIEIIRELIAQLLALLQQGNQGN